MAITAPDETNRWRCSRCGNLTRFDVVRTTRAKQYWHFDLSGDVEVQEEDALVDTIDSVSCRWCGAGDTVELVPRAADA